ncbi:MAG TPA: glycosyltransferase family 39 protein, partial [Thermoanaerobaculia bacterium]|nr:glycosyltransferase family 39 protein [Thermoanaerobaculia bacterium]
MEWILFSLGLLVYMATRLWGITRFPIYFFCDEANPSVLAELVFANGLRDQYGTFFPLYFELAPGRWCPELQVYFHGLGSLLFGKSVLVTRTTQVFVCVLAPIAVALALRLVFKARSWWVGPFLLALSPAWFLHSRTGFDPVVMATFYACFLLGYLLYRTRSPRYLFAAAAFGAATFYSYSNGQMVMVAAVFLLAVTDVPFHRKNWKVVLQALALAAVLAIPAIRFQTAAPKALGEQLRVVGSYWFTSQPVHQKALQFVRTYAHGLSPTYWFGETDEQVRHKMKGYGRINRWLLPVFLVGVGVAAWRAFRGSAPHRILLIAALATPAGAALAEVGITRVFAFLIPATLLIGVGLEALYSWTVRRLPEAAVAVALSVGLTVPSVAMVTDSLANGPVWFDDYTLYGMQYGARQVFGEMVPDLLQEFP